jgi:transcription elongation GreA/GreB family factor
MSTITSPRRPSRPRRTETRQLEVPLTADGRVRLEARLESLYADALPQLRPLLVGRERDERDVAAFERLVAEAQQLEAVLGCAVAAPSSQDGTVVLGSRVRIRMPDGERLWVRPVHPVEAALDDERISVASPLSQALLGRDAGEDVTVRGPAGEWVAHVLEVR